MTKNELLLQLSSFGAKQQQQWLLALGANLTASARGAYGSEADQADGSKLKGYNELQHQLYNRIHALPDGREWPLESFLDIVHEKATHFDIWADVSWSLQKAVEYVKAKSGTVDEQENNEQVGKCE